MRTEYKIYEIDNNHLKECEKDFRDFEKRVCLIELDLGSDFNSFEKKEQAINYIVEKQMKYTDFTILKVISLWETK